MSIDLSLFQLITSFSHQYNWLDAVGIFGAKHLVFILGVLVLLSLWFSISGRVIATIQLAFSVLFAWGLTLGVQHLIARPRPFEGLNTEPLIDMWHSTFSFPSGHATIAFALAGFAYFYHKRFGKYLLVIAALVALSRVFVGVHYPIDILAGALIGFVVSWAIHVFQERYF